jgi:hypothetical protein
MHARSASLALGFGQEDADDLRISRPILRA